MYHVHCRYTLSYTFSQFGFISIFFSIIDYFGSNFQIPIQKQKSEQ